MASSLYEQCLLGLQCTDFAMVAADQNNILRGIVMKNDDNKLYQITDKLLIGVMGDQGDAAQFAQFVEKNLQLYQMRNKYGLDTAAAVHFTRKTLADTLKAASFTPYGTLLNMLIVGHNEKEGGQLYSLDMQASCVKVPYAVHGFGGLLCMSILSYYHNYNLTESEAYEIMKVCVQVIHQRLFINLPSFQVKVVSKDGIKELPIINSFSIDNSSS